VVLAAGLVAASQVVTGERFRSIAFEHYSDSEGLRVALDAIRSELSAEDRLVIVGSSNDLSPALFRWELGPPSGVPCFPYEIAGAGRLDLGLATRALLIMPDDPANPPLDLAPYYQTRAREVLAAADRGDLSLDREIALPDLDAILRLYRRSSPPAQTVDCR
jgi:hypothetical protein